MIDIQPIKCMENIPKRTKKEDWESFIEMCSTDEEKIKREKGKLSREHMKLPHTSGRLGCARIEEELIKESPDGTVTRTHVFVATHTSKDGSCPFLELRPSLDEIKRLVSLDPYLGEKDLDNDPVAKVIGRDGKGRVRGLGTGVTKTVAGIYLYSIKKSGVGPKGAVCQLSTIAQESTGSLLIWSSKVVG
ncbi:hypothetical protein IFM89_015032 [Coptis chinensis]|uniref:Uncharacterized protein n=1 Tax=Coptis chinensis TaxID=261450 RepID=A0A835HMM2_9MAGN|nr:hypothetical protein IFM89_015032 [Coptis chinensis]